MTLTIQNLKNGAKDLLISRSGTVDHLKTVSLTENVITRNGRIGQLQLTQIKMVNSIMEGGLSNCHGITTMDPFRKSLSEVLLTVICTCSSIRTK